MLPGLGFSEVLVLGVIALLVVGPKDLPLMLRKLGRQMARLRGLANEFRTGFDELARQAELDELKREVDALRRGQVFTEAEMEQMRVLDPIPSTAPLLGPPAPSPAYGIETGDTARERATVAGEGAGAPETPEPAPPEVPEPPVEPPAPPEIPPLSPPAPTPEPVTARALP